MFGSELRNLYASVAQVYHILRNAEDLVSEYDGHRSVRRDGEMGQKDAAVTLFDGIDRVAHPMEFGYRLLRVGEIAAVHRGLRPESRLVYLYILRSRTDATEPNTIDQEGVRRPEDGPDVVLAAHVIEYGDHRALGRSVKLRLAETAHLFYFSLNN